MTKPSLPGDLQPEYQVLYDTISFLPSILRASQPSPYQKPTHLGEELLHRKEKWNSGDICWIPSSNSHAYNPSYLGL